MIRSKIGAASIEDKMREVRLRCFGHIKSMDALVKRCKNSKGLYQRRSRGRPKKSWSKVIRHDLKTLGLVEGITQDRRLWRSKINVADV